MLTATFRLPASLALAILSTLPIRAVPPKGEDSAAGSAAAAAAPASSVSGMDPQEEAYRAALADPVNRLPLGLVAAKILAEHLDVGVQVVAVAPDRDQDQSDHDSVILRHLRNLNWDQAKEWDARILLYHNQSFALLEPPKQGQERQYVVLHGLGGEDFRLAANSGPQDGDSLIRAMLQLADQPAPDADGLAALRALLVASMTSTELRRDMLAQHGQAARHPDPGPRIKALLGLAAEFADPQGHQSGSAAASSSSRPLAVLEASLLEEERQLRETLERSMNDYHQPSAPAAAASAASASGGYGSAAPIWAMTEQKQLEAALASSLSPEQPPASAAVAFDPSSFPPPAPRASSRPTPDDGVCPMEIEEAPGEQDQPSGQK